MRQFLRRDEAAAQPLSGGAQSDDQRSATRYTLLIRAAKLISPAGEFLCVIRDASESGVNIRTFHPLPDCEAMVIELQNGDRHELDLVWQEADRAGLKFAREADIRRIIESPSRFTKRPLRINLDIPAMLESGPQQAEVRILDISQQGAKIACDERFAIEQRVRLSAPEFRETNAKIRWRRESQLGLIFEDTYQFGDFARIIADLQLENCTRR